MDWVDTGASFFAGWGDTLTFGGTRRFRQWAGIDSAVDYGSGAYHAGQHAGALNAAGIGAYVGASIGVRLLGQAAATGAGGTIYIRLVNAEEAGNIAAAGGAVVSEGTKIAGTTRVFQPPSWPFMYRFATHPDSAHLGYEFVATFETSAQLTNLGWDFQPHTFYVSVNELNGLLTTPPTITPIGQFRP